MAGSKPFTPNMWRLTGLCALVLLCSGCSQIGLLTKGDYKKSQQDFLKSDTSGALRDFPSWVEDGHVVEEGDFITTIEKAYLSLIQGKPDIEGLQKQAAVLENKLRYHVSRDGKTFFYAQTPEDYYPSEHEIVWLHFLLSWGYSLQAKYPEACGQAREARNLLSPPNNPPGHFDDPMLRIFLATLWTMCGDWHEAQADLRTASTMDNTLPWAETLAEREHPPAHLFAVLGGPGPEVESNRDSPNPAHPERLFRFKLRGLKSKLSISDQHGVAIASYLSPDASPWYERNMVRETELHYMLAGSAYVSSAVTEPKMYYWALIGGVTGTYLGLVLFEPKGANPTQNAYYRSMVGTLGGGLLGAAIGAAWGAYVDRRESAEGVAGHTPERYRFVRYLPEYLWLGWGDQPVAYPVELRTPRYHAAVQQPTVRNNNVSISVAHIVDAAP